MPMSQPKPSQLKAGAKVLSAPVSAGAAAVTAQPGDVITHASGAGWHVCTKATTVPVGGYPANSSDDNVRWSTGPSFSGQGIPPSPGTAPTTQDGAQTGYGSDGRGVNSDGTIGGAGYTAGGGSPARGW